MFRTMRNKTIDGYGLDVNTQTLNNCGQFFVTFDKILDARKMNSFE